MPRGSTLRMGRIQRCPEGRWPTLELGSSRPLPRTTRERTTGSCCWTHRARPAIRSIIRTAGSKVRREHGVLVGKVARRCKRLPRASWPNAAGIAQRDWWFGSLATHQLTSSFRVPSSSSEKTAHLCMASTRWRLMHPVRAQAHRSRLEALPFWTPMWLRPSRIWGRSWTRPGANLPTFEPSDSSK